MEKFEIHVRRRNLDIAEKFGEKYCGNWPRISKHQCMYLHMSASENSFELDLFSESEFVLTYNEKTEVTLELFYQTITASPCHVLQ